MAGGFEQLMNSNFAELEDMYLLPVESDGLLHYAISHQKINTAKAISLVIPLAAL